MAGRAWSSSSLERSHWDLSKTEKMCWTMPGPPRTPACQCWRNQVPGNPGRFCATGQALQTPGLGAKVPAPPRRRAGGRAGGWVVGWCPGEPRPVQHWGKELSRKGSTFAL
eukprot:gene11600-biopygen21411